MHLVIMSRRLQYAVGFLLALTFLLDRPARAQSYLVGPGGKQSYIELHGEMFRDFDGVDGGVGGAFEFGSLQNRYIAVGTIIAFERNGPGTKLPEDLYLGAGFSGHIPIGKHIIVMPELSLGYQLVDANGAIGGNLAAFMMLGVAYRLRQFYFGVEAQRPIYEVLPGEPSGFFPNLTTGGIFLGMYF
jgi:hypothetical protein